MTARIIAY